jgi:hypothetical protein
MRLTGMMHNNNNVRPGNCLQNSKRLDGIRRPSSGIADHGDSCWLHRQSDPKKTSKIEVIDDNSLLNFASSPRISCGFTRGSEHDRTSTPDPLAFAISTILRNPGGDVWVEAYLLGEEGEVK